MIEIEKAIMESKAAAYDAIDRILSMNNISDWARLMLIISAWGASECQISVIMNHGLLQIKGPGTTVGLDGKEIKQQQEGEG